ncbi:MAG: hypothetical protein WBG71_00035 [Leeuwenhoekiella sp.]
MITDINILFSLGCQFFTIFMLLRSLLHLYRVRKIMEAKTFWFCSLWICLGTTLAMFNVSDIDYMQQRFPFNVLFYTGSAMVVFTLTKKTKESLYTIGNVMKLENNILENAAIEKVVNGGCVNKNLLLDFDMGKFYETCKKTAIIRLKSPLQKSIAFKATMLKNGTFGRQYHPDLDEEIHIDYGALLDKVSGKIYRKNDVWNIPAGVDHEPVALSRVDLRSYLTDIKTPL